MERRKFLKYLGAGSALAAVGAIGLNSFHGSIKNMILKDTEGMNISEKEVDKFIADANNEFYWNQFDLSKKGFIIAHTWIGLELLPYKIKYTQYRSQIVGTFLLSTNFFINKMKPDTKIQYVAFYNPYKMACGSPFSYFHYPS